MRKINDSEGIDEIIRQSFSTDGPNFPRIEGRDYVYTTIPDEADQMFFPRTDLTGRELYAPLQYLGMRLVIDGDVF